MLNEMNKKKKTGSLKRFVAVGYVLFYKYIM